MLYQLSYWSHTLGARSIGGLLCISDEGSNPVEALNFFQASLFQLLKLEIHCDNHLSLSYPVIRSSYMNHFIYITSYCSLSFVLLTVAIAWFSQNVLIMQFSRFRDSLWLLKLIWITQSDCLFWAQNKQSPDCLFWALYKWKFRSWIWLNKVLITWLVLVGMLVEVSW